MRCTRAKTRPFLSFSSPGLPRLVVIRAYSGIPSPHCGPPLSIHEGDIIELLLADLHSSWWQVRVTPRPLRFNSASAGARWKKHVTMARWGWWGGGMSLQHHQLGSVLRVFAADWAERKDEQSKASHHLRVSGTPGLASSSLGHLAYSLRRLSVWPRRLHLMS